MTTLSFKDAIRETLRTEMERDETVYVLGENVGTKGGSAEVLAGFREEFGEDRVRETPVSENAIAGSVLGAALDGLRPVAELYQGDFFYAIGNEIINDIPKWRYQQRLDIDLPIVLRAQMGVTFEGGSGPEHSQCPEAFLHNAPGLTILTPGTPTDAMGLLRSALRGGDPVIFLEHKRLYSQEGDVPDDDDFTLPFSEGVVRRPGTDVTIVAWAWMQQEALRAADQLDQRGVEVEVIDPRTVKPFDFETVIDSVEKTGNLIVVEETPRTGSIGGEIITRVVEAGVEMDSHPSRLTYPNIPHPYNPTVEAYHLPDAEKIVKTAVELVQ